MYFFPLVFTSVNESRIYLGFYFAISQIYACFRVLNFGILESDHLKFMRKNLTIKKATTNSTSQGIKFLLFSTLHFFIFRNLLQ